MEMFKAGFAVFHDMWMNFYHHSPILALLSIAVLLALLIAISKRPQKKENVSELFDLNARANDPWVKPMFIVVYAPIGFTLSVISLVAGIFLEAVSCYYEFRNSKKSNSLK